jgi:hypothetical protein
MRGPWALKKKKMRGPRWWEGQSSEEFGYRRENKKEWITSKQKRMKKWYSRYFDSFSLFT